MMEGKVYGNVILTELDNDQTMESEFLQTPLSPTKISVIRHIHCK